MRKYRRIILDCEIIDLPERKEKRVIICNDIIVFATKIASDIDSLQFQCKVVPVPSEMYCKIIDEKICTVTSVFGWDLWSWECTDPKLCKNALLQAKRFVASRSEMLFNRSGSSLDSLLPLEFIKICEEIQQSQVSYPYKNSY